MEDDASVRSAVTALLTSFGLQVDACDGGTAALECLQETRYDALLSDVSMPGMDGIEVAERATAMLP